MSLVTNVLLQVDILEDRSGIQGRLPVFGENHGGLQALRNISSDEHGELWGGSRMPEVVILAAAFNYVPADEIREKLAAFPWKYPQSLRLMIQEQKHRSLAVYVFRNGDWLCVLAPEHG